MWGESGMEKGTPRLTLKSRELSPAYPSDSMKAPCSVPQVLGVPQLGWSLQHRGGRRLPFGLPRPEIGSTLSSHGALGGATLK